MTPKVQETLGGAVRIGLGPSALFLRPVFFVPCQKGREFIGHSDQNRGNRMSPNGRPALEENR